MVRTASILWDPDDYLPVKPAIKDLFLWEGYFTDRIPGFARRRQMAIVELAKFDRQAVSPVKRYSVTAALARTNPVSLYSQSTRYPKKPL